MSFTDSYTRAKKIADKTGATIEIAFQCLMEVELMQKENHDANCTTPESREKIQKYLDENNGVVQNLTPQDICLNAGVKPNRGNVQWAKKHKLLTHQPA